MAQCHYVFRNGQRCLHEDHGHGLCFWHDPTVSKEGQTLAADLESMLRTGQQVEGFSMCSADLSCLDLVNRGKHEGFSLSQTDLYRANLRGAHLFMTDMSNASLMKADLREANLHHANLQNANLLGTKFDNAKIENVFWGDQLLQEKKAKEAEQENNLKLADDYYEQMEEICRNIRNVAGSQGLVNLAGDFFYKEMVARRKQLPRFSFNRLVSKIVDLSCGYGEKPTNVFVFSIAMVLISSVLFFFFGIEYGGEHISFNWNQSASENVGAFFTSIYYSVVTFTTLGYGDLVPVGISRLFAALEAFLGSFTMALFVVVFVKKMTR
jgi:hypothetical protein